MRSAPQRGLAAAISRMMAAWVLGFRPVGRDRQRQRRRKPARCHRRTVAGCTTARAERQVAVIGARFPMSQR
jgi:hypothetical protein